MRFQTQRLTGLERRIRFDPGGDLITGPETQRRDTSTNISAANDVDEILRHLFPVFGVDIQCFEFSI